MKEVSKRTAHWNDTAGFVLRGSRWKPSTERSANVRGMQVRGVGVAKAAGEVQTLTMTRTPVSRKTYAIHEIQEL